jgi:hypothetical protein
MVTCVLESECNEDQGDGIHFLYGAKIKEKWYFFKGAYIFLPRKMYASKNKEHEPLSFIKLHELAIKNIYNGYLKKDAKGQWIIDDDYFNGLATKNLTTGGYGSCFECKTEEEYFLYLVHRNWKKK